MSEVLRGVAVGTGFLVIFAAAELWRRYGTPPVAYPEAVQPLSNLQSSRDGASRA